MCWPAGSAVGREPLGFAYRALQGGGAFLLLYVLIVLLVCLPVLVAEMALDAARHSPAGTGDGGGLSLAAGLAVRACGQWNLAFYAVLMGWTGATLVQTITQDFRRSRCC